MTASVGSIRARARTRASVSQSLVARRPTSLDLAAVALIVASIALETAALIRRGRTAHGAMQCHQLAHPTPCTGSKRPWPQLAMMLGLAALVMSVCTAMGAGAARRLGIVPRTWRGLPGVVFGCFVHQSWQHCGWNALGLMLLGPCVLRAAPSAGDAGRAGQAGPAGRGTGAVVPFAEATAFIALSSGFCVWCLARPALHAGASGVVCGYIGLLLALTVRRQDSGGTTCLTLLV